MAENRSATPLSEIFVNSGVFRTLVEARHEGLAAALGQAFKTESAQPVFDVLNQIAEASDLDNRYDVIHEVLQTLRYSKQEGVAAQADQFEQKLMSEVHPSRASRVEAARAQLLLRYGTGFQQMVDQKMPSITAQGTSSDPLMVSAEEALYLSLTNKNGDPVYFGNRNNPQAPLRIADGLNGVVKDVPAENPEAMAQLVNLSRSESFAARISRLNSKMSGDGQEATPFQCTDKTNAIEEDLLVGLMASAAKGEPMHVLTQGVLVQVDARDRSSRYIAGSSVNINRSTQRVVEAIKNVNTMINDYADMSESEPAKSVSSTETAPSDANPKFRDRVLAGLQRVLSGNK